MLDPEDPETYRRIAGVLIERGHCKNELEDTKGRVCAGGAIWFLNDHGYHHNDKFEAIAGALCQTLGLGGPGWGNWNLMVAWNNAPERTAGEVIDGFLAVAKRKDEEALQAVAPPIAPPKPKPQPGGPMGPPPDEDPDAPPDTEP